MKTCATCKHIGVAYWGHHSDYGGETHLCGKSDARRQDQMKPTGDLAEDFMRNFRTFFDAKAKQASCKYYEEQEVLSKPQRASGAESGKGDAS